MLIAVLEQIMQLVVFAMRHNSSYVEKSIHSIFSRGTGESYL